MSGGLTIAMLGWKAKATTRRTLESWARADLHHCADEFFLFFNQISNSDRALAAEFGVDCRGSEKNLGIWAGKEAILNEAKGDYILFLDDDHDIVVSREETKKWIGDSLDLLKRESADAVILLNRFERIAAWGDSHFFDYHYIRDIDPRAAKCIPYDYIGWNRDTFFRKCHRLLRPFASRRRISGAAPYLERNPELIWPKYITREGSFFILDSAIQPFCDSPIMMSCEFYRKLCAWGHEHPCRRTILGFQELEHIMNCHWWRGSHFRTAVCDGGIFGHHRVDDSWRSDNEKFNPALTAEALKR